MEYSRGKKMLMLTRDCDKKCNEGILQASKLFADEYKVSNCQETRIKEDVSHTVSLCENVSNILSPTPTKVTQDDTKKLHELQHEVSDILMSYPSLSTVMPVVPCNNVPLNSNEVLPNKIDFSVTSNAESLGKKIPILNKIAVETSSKISKKRKISKTDEKDMASKHLMLPPCVCKMKKCYTKLDEDMRENIHKHFWNLDYENRKLWIYNHVEKIEPKRRYTDIIRKKAEINTIVEGEFEESKEVRIEFSRNYWLPVAKSSNKKIYVCKEMFLNTIGHKSDKVVTTALKTVTDLGTDIIGDKRGKHNPKHSMTVEQREFMVKHIQSFKPQITHYRREHAPNRLYLPPELTLSEMYADYIEECKKSENREFGYVSYTKQVKSMNISFAKLGNEDCEICDEHKLHITNSHVTTATGNVSESYDEERVKKNGKIIKKRKMEYDNVCGENKCQQCISWKEHMQRYRNTRDEYKTVKECAEKSDTLYLSSDMLKVILIPRLPGYKVCLFTKRLVVINQSFAPINKADVHKKKSLGVIWHEEISGRKDEDVTSAFLKALEYFRDFTNIVIWLDNCSGQNKNWTLYTALTHIVNTPTGPNTITLKYFTVGHTFMSADNFHQKVEGEMKKMKTVCDWIDFKTCVQNAGNIYEMDISDFKNYESGLSQGKQSKKTRPLLETVSAVQFRKGSTSLHFKLSHTEKEFKVAEYLKQKIVTSIRNGDYKIQSKTIARGINAEKKAHIIKNLGPLMPP